MRTPDVIPQGLGHGVGLGTNVTGKRPFPCVGLLVSRPGRCVRERLRANSARVGLYAVVLVLVLTEFLGRPETFVADSAGESFGVVGSVGRHSRRGLENLRAEAASVARGWYFFVFVFHLLVFVLLLVD